MEILVVANVKVAVRAEVEPHRAALTGRLQNRVVENLFKRTVFRDRDEITALRRVGFLHIGVHSTEVRDVQVKNVRVEVGDRHSVRRVVGGAEVGEEGRFRFGGQSDGAAKENARRKSEGRFRNFHLKPRVNVETSTLPKKAKNVGKSV